MLLTPHMLWNDIVLKITESRNAEDIVIIITDIITTETHTLVSCVNG